MGCPWGLRKGLRQTHSGCRRDSQSSGTLPAGPVPLRPDLGWAESGLWRFVGDVKYKKDSGSGHSADIYQALAYALATGLPTATLFYAEGGRDQDHLIPAADKVIKVRHLPGLATRANAGAIRSLVRGVRALGW